MVHVLWEYLAYSSYCSRANFMIKLEKLLGDRYALLNIYSIEKTSYIIRSELWAKNLKSLFKSIFIVNVWEVKGYNYGDESYPNQLQSQSSTGGLSHQTSPAPSHTCQFAPRVEMLDSSFDKVFLT